MNVTGPYFRHAGLFVAVAAMAVAAGWLYATIVRLLT